MIKKALIALGIAPVAALAQEGGSTSLATPEFVTTALSNAGTLSTNLATSTGSQVMSIALPWIGIAVVLFVVALVWRFARGRGSR